MWMSSDGIFLSRVAEFSSELRLSKSSSGEWLVYSGTWAIEKTSSKHTVFLEHAGFICLQAAQQYQALPRTPPALQQASKQSPLGP